jgi:hypothetical protein
MKKQRRCHCGHEMGHAAIEEEPEYTTWGWIMLSMLGMTPRPDHIAFRCMYCRKEVGRSRDPKLLAMRTPRNRATV